MAQNRVLTFPLALYSASLSVHANNHTHTPPPLVTVLRKTYLRYVRVRNMVTAAHRARSRRHYNLASVLRLRLRADESTCALGALPPLGAVPIDKTHLILIYVYIYLFYVSWLPTSSHYEGVVTSSYIGQLFGYFATSDTLQLQTGISTCTGVDFTALCVIRGCPPG